MSLLANLAVDLRSQLPSKIGALRAIERAGFSLREIPPRTDDAVLAWIDETFGGSWSSEAFSGTTIVAYDATGNHAGFVTYDPQGLRFRWLRGFANESGVGIFGPIGVAPNYRGARLAEGETLGRNLVTLALEGLRDRAYVRAIIPAVGDRRLIDYYKRSASAEIVEEFDKAAWFERIVPTVVMASGNGSNFQAVLDCVQRGELPLYINALVCNKNDAFAIERARQAKIPVCVLPWDRKNTTRESYDAELLRVLERERPELTLLLGWMHVLPAAFVEAFPSAMNIHPAYLPHDQSQDTVACSDGSTIPAFRGARAIQDAVLAGVSWVGASAHRLTSQADRGSILIRRPIFIGDIPTPPEPERHVLADTVFERLHPIEHTVVAAAIRRTIYES